MRPPGHWGLSKRRGSYVRFRLGGRARPAMSPGSIDGNSAIVNLRVRPARPPAQGQLHRRMETGRRTHATAPAKPSPGKTSVSHHDRPSSSPRIVSTRSSGRESPRPAALRRASFQGPDPEELRPGRLGLPVGPEAPLFGGKVVAGERARVAERPDAFDVDADLAELAHGAERESARVAEIEEERRSIAGCVAHARRYQPGLSVCSVFQRQLAGRDLQVLGEETSQRDAGAARIGRAPSR